jgi:hypothetical protein
VDCRHSEATWRTLLAIEVFVADAALQGDVDRLLSEPLYEVRVFFVMAFVCVRVSAMEVEKKVEGVEAMKSNQ